MGCLSPPLAALPQGDEWLCPYCAAHVMLFPPEDDFEEEEEEDGAKATGKKKKKKKTNKAGKKEQKKRGKKRRRGDDDEVVYAADVDDEDEDEDDDDEREGVSEDEDDWAFPDDDDDDDDDDEYRSSDDSGKRGPGGGGKAAANVSASDWIQCDDCQKWRRLPASEVRSLPTDAPWTCALNAPFDRSRASCGAPEESFRAAAAAADPERVFPPPDAVDEAEEGVGGVRRGDALCALCALPEGHLVCRAAAAPAAAAAARLFGGGGGGHGVSAGGTTTTTTSSSSSSSPPSFSLGPMLPKPIVLTMRGGGGGGGGVRSSAWVHERCARHSAEVEENREGRLVRVAAAIKRGRQCPCTRKGCGRKGATVGCQVAACSVNVHVGCLDMDPDEMPAIGFFCKAHR